MSKDDGFMVTILAALIADAQWDKADLSKTEGLDYLHKFVKSLVDKNGAATSKIIYDETYLILRGMLMWKLRERSDILSIQKDPAFSNWGRQNMISLAEAYLEDGDSALSNASQVLFHAGRVMNKPQQKAIIFEENTGESKETAVIIRRAENHREGVTSEYWYLHYKYGRNFGSSIKDWDLRQQLLTSDGETGKKYDVLRIHFPNGTEREVYFDITDFHGRN